MTDWILAIDFGTTSTAAAIRVGGMVERIEIDGAPRMPSMVFWREGTSGSSSGRLVLGEEAGELAGLAPWCLERTPKRRIGDEFIRLGEKELRVTDVIGAILRKVADEAIRRRGGELPAELRLTHPARWGRGSLEKLRQAAKIAGFESPRFVPEPVAAAMHFASARLAPGQHVAVYDLGGGTFDTAVLKRTEDSFEVVGEPGGREDLGGEDFDDRVYRYLARQLPEDKRLALSESKERPWMQASRELLRNACRTKEYLSRSPQYEFYMPPPIDQELLAGAETFRELIIADVEATAAELERTIRDASLDPIGLVAIYLAGGSSRIPLVARVIQQRLGQLPETLDDPKAVTVLGAARIPLPDAPDRPTQPTDADRPIDRPPQQTVVTPPALPATSPLDATPQQSAETKRAEPNVSAAHTGAAATTATDATIPSEPLAIAETGSAAPQKVEAGPVPIHARRRDSTPAEHPPRAGSPSHPAFPRRFSRPWMVLLAGGALAVALVVWLISGSGSHHNPSTASAGATTVHPAAQWRQLQPLPRPVTAAGVAEYQNEIWVVGGTRDKHHDAISDVYVMDPRGQSGWSRGPRLLEPRAKAAVVSSGARLYVIGGFGPDGRAVKTVLRLDGPTQQWRPDARSLPDNRTAGAAAYDGTRIVFAGGNIDGHPEGNVWALGEDRWTRVGMLHAARDQLAAAGNGGKVWFIGGGLGPSSAAASSMVDVVHGSRVDPGTPLTEAVRRPAAVNIGSGFCAIGGHRQGAAKPGSPGSAAVVSGRVQCQGIHGSIPGVLPRVDSGAAVLDDTIYVVGGYDPTQRVGTTTVQALDLRGG